MPPDLPPLRRRAIRKYEIPATYGVSRWKVAELIRTGALPSTKVGRVVLIDVAVADAVFGVRHGDR